MVRITLKNITKRFGPITAVNKLSLEIKDGEFMVLLGPSGSGKSTILRLIAGLEYPDEGEIYFDNELVNDIPPQKRDVAMVFQNYALYPHMTVFDNIALPLKIRKVPKEEIRRRVLEVAEMLNIRDQLHKKPSQLSGGQQQRVALARAIIRHPRVFLMDEPLSNLDERIRIKVRGELKALQKKLGVTTIYVTHDQEEAMTLGDRIAVLREGVLQQVGPPEEIYNSPRNLFVAKFLGRPPINVFKACIKSANNRTIAETEAFQVDLTDFINSHFQLSSSSEVFLAIRPEHIKIFKEEISQGIEARVHVIQPVGRETYIQVELKDGSLVNVIVPPKLNLKIGDRVFIRFSRNDLLLFNGKTEERIYCKG